MATKKVILYPSTIDTAKERSTKTNIQKLSEKGNLKSGNNELAYWGVQKPEFKGNYLRNYPDSLTSISGSFYKPAEFIASGFKASGVHSKSVVKNIWVEYKWEQISYSSTTAFGEFDKPVIKLKKNKTQLDKISGARPEPNRYNNCKKGACKNTNSANLATQHTHKFNFSKKITMKDLKDKISIVFTPSKNKSHNHLRIVMQYFRIIVEYEPYRKKETPHIEEPPDEDVPDIEYPPVFDIRSQINVPEITTNDEYEYTVEIFNTTPDNDINNNVWCNIRIPPNTTISVKDKIGAGPHSINNSGCQWGIEEFVNDRAQMTLVCKTSKRNLNATYYGEFFYSEESGYQQQKQVASSIKILSNEIDFKFTTDLTPPMVFSSSNIQGVTTSKDAAGFFKISLSRQDRSKYTEKIHINMQKLLVPKEEFLQLNSNTVMTWAEPEPNSGLPTPDYNHLKNGSAAKDGFDWVFDNVQDYKYDDKTEIGTKVELSSTELNVVDLTPGRYIFTAVHEENGKFITRSIEFVVIARTLPKDFFKLRIEDGTDVKYNSLIFTMGDDLETPITYQMEDEDEDFKNNMIVIGEQTRLSTKEAKYVSFDVYIESDTDETYQNVVAYLNAYDENDSCNHILIGGDSNVELYNDDYEKTPYCIIKELKTNTHNNIKFIVESNIPREAVVKLNPLNYDEYDSQKWMPMRLYFEDIPNVEIKIEGPSEISYNNDEDGIFTLNYIIQNKSNVKGENIKFKITEPSAFKRDVPTEDNNQVGAYLYGADGMMFNSPTFDAKKRIINFPELDANSSKYILSVTYQATKKGIYEFDIHTVDYSDTMRDDQYYNIYRHKTFVNVMSDLDIKTSVDNDHPYLGDIIEYNIKMRNYSKRQEDVIIDIYDIGQYDNFHEECHYDIVEYNGDGNFEDETLQENNILGTWTVNNIKPGEFNQLTLYLRPLDTKTHVIRAIATDKTHNTETFENPVQVYLPDNKIDLNVYHAINQTENDNCCNPNILTEICDDDFINIDDSVYYVFDITNKELNQKTVSVYARVPKTFEITQCYTQTYPYRITNNGLIVFDDLKIPACSNIKFCIKVIPKQKGTFISNFVLSSKNTKILSKKLNLTVDSYFDERKTEHQITIYNFEKTNKYFRYELDGNDNLFKFYNKGDKSKRTVDIESHNASQLETYRGSTLKELVDKIRENSKYVEPELIRIGSNHLQTKGYELYPNGFINRFGLLNSEVYHYTGQLPTIGNLVDYALRWDSDVWDEKLWSGDIYQNGVFDLTVNYSKIPTNFNILELTYPLQNLQALVDKVKPFGTKAICYFSFDVKFKLKLAMEILATQIIDTEEFEFKLANDFGMISWYNRHDNSIAIYFDLTKFYIDIDEPTINSLISDKDYYFYPQISEEIERDGHIIQEPNMTYNIDVFTNKKSYQYIKDCYDIVRNLQTTNNHTRNITISKQDIDKNKAHPNSNEEFSITNDMLYNFYYDYDINYDEEIGICVTTNKQKIYCKYSKDKKVSDRFDLIDENENIINTIYVDGITNFKIQVQCYDLNVKEKILHFWVSINQHDYEYLGYFITDNSYISKINVFNKTSNEESNINAYTYTCIIGKDTPITFSIDDNDKYETSKISEYYATNSFVKWNNLKNINNQTIFIKSEKDSNCKNKTIKPPKLMLRYDKFNVDDFDEIEDVYFNIKSNQNLENIKVGVFRDGSYYLPRKMIGQKTYAPNYVGNVSQEYNATIGIQQPNITLCSNCLKTSLGYYDKCPHCSSDLVTHEKEKMDVTICYNCGWVEDGWHDYCKHCLSQDVVKTVVDYNKTYCYNCQSLHDDYYPACPYCFSTNIIHLQNDSVMNRIFNKETINIDPVVIQSDVNKINVCNLNIPLNKNTKDIDLLRSLKLVMDITNNSVSEYYYCEECEAAGLGNPERCPYCNTNDPEKYHLFNLYDNDKILSNLNISAYYLVNGKLKEYKFNDNENNILENQKIELDILDMVKDNSRDSFTIQIYAENPIYYKIQNDINKLKFEEKYIKEAIKASFMDMRINNIYLSSKFIDENKWDIGKIQGENRTGIKYVTDKTETEYVSFNFNVDMQNTTELKLHINGVNKSLSHAKMNIKVLSDNYSYDFNTFVKSNIFKIEEDIYQNLLNLENITVQINFYDVETNSEIIITDCYLVANGKNHKIHVPQLDDQGIIVDNYKDKNYKISSQNAWGLNEVSTKYIIGDMLETGLLACFEFEDIEVGNRLNIHDIEMIVRYRNKMGTIMTDPLPITDNSLITQMVNADVIKNNGENWGALKVGAIGLNNLESEIINTDDERLLDSIPILNSVYQSFTPDTNSFYKIILEYAGKRGYPSDHITVSIYDDLNNAPDILLSEQEILLPSVMKNIEINVYMDDLDTNKKYWLVLEDINADENNYHKFAHNQNKEIGTMLIKQNDAITKYDHMVLSFAIENGYDIREFLEYPHTFEIDNDVNNDFRLYDSLFRFDGQVNSNVYLNNLFIKSGYKIEEPFDDAEDEEETIPDEYNTIYDSDKIKEKEHEAENTSECPKIKYPNYFQLGE